VRQYGPERIIVNSAADWGLSDPLAVLKTADLNAQNQGFRRSISAMTTLSNAINLHLLKWTRMDEAKKWLMQHFDQLKK